MNFIVIPLPPVKPLVVLIIIGTLTLWLLGACAGPVQIDGTLVCVHTGESLLCTR